MAQECNTQIIMIYSSKVTDRIMYTPYHADKIFHKLCVGYTIATFISELTSTRKSTACISSVAKAGITPFSVVATCIIMTDISASSAFIHICSSNSKVVLVCSSVMRIVHD